VNLLRLLRCGDLTSSDGPYRLVRDDYLVPVLLGQLFRHGFELCSHDLDGLARFALFERFAAAEDHVDAAIDRSFGLGSNEGVVFLQDHSALGVAQDGPGNAGVSELIDADFTRKCAVGLVKDILRCNFNSSSQVFACEKQVERRWSNDNLWER